MPHEDGHTKDPFKTPDLREATDEDMDMDDGRQATDRSTLSKLRTAAKKAGAKRRVKAKAKAAKTRRKKREITSTASAVKDAAASTKAGRLAKRTRDAATRASDRAMSAGERFDAGDFGDGVAEFDDSDLAPDTGGGGGMGSGSLDPVDADDFGGGDSSMTDPTSDIDPYE